MQTDHEEAPRPLAIVGGSLALDFANTVDDPTGPLRWDHVADYRHLLEWSERAGALSGAEVAAMRRAARRDPDGAAEVVADGVMLRDALNDTFGRCVDGEDIEPGWARLRPVVLSAVAAMGAPVTATWRRDDLGTPLWAVATSAYDLLRGPELGRLKRCGNCPWLFLDRSKNQSRRWCSMEDCGTALKIRRYVAKRAAS